MLHADGTHHGREVTRQYTLNYFLGHLLLAAPGLKLSASPNSRREMKGAPRLVIDYGLAIDRRLDRDSADLCSQNRGPYSEKS